jgi:hypothetical protein
MKKRSAKASSHFIEVLRREVAEWHGSNQTESKWEGLLFHDLRRSAVRNMVRRGVSEQSPCVCPGIKPEVFSYAMTSPALATLKIAANKIERGSKVFENRTDTTTSTDDDSDATLEAPMTM